MSAALHAKLAARIRAAFTDKTPPADDELLHPDCMDDGDVQEFYGGVDWRDMTDDMVAYSYAAPSFFSPAAFRYYLPAFMLSALRDKDRKVYASESILMHLDPGTEAETLHAFRLSKFDALTAPQIAVIRDFLLHMSGDPELGEFADAALINHWLDG